MRPHWPRFFFEYVDYKEVLRDAIAACRQISGYQTRLAEGAGCQKSYLSQVLKTNANLSEDHAAGIAQLWDLNCRETDFWLDLVRYERAGTTLLRNLVAERLKAARDDARRADRRFEDSDEVDPEDRAAFYLKWYMSATYMLIQCKGMDGSQAIADRLKLPKATIDEAIAQLRRLKLVEEQDDGQLVQTKANIFLRNSQFHMAYSSTWRQIAVAKLHTSDPVKETFFTGLFTVKKENVLRIQEQILELLEKSKCIAHEEQTNEELVCLNLDYFKV